MISKCKAAVFDMDGTLLESMKYWRFAALEYLMAKHIPISEEALAGVFRRSAGATVKLAYEHAGLDPETIDPELGNEILALVVPHYEKDIFPKDGALEYVKKLHDNGVVCCVATATDKKYASKVLEKFGFDKYIEFVFDTSDAGCSKAHIKYFQKVSERLGIPLDECVMYEDALYSIKTAKQAGMRVVAIEDDCAKVSKDEIIGLADVYAESYAQLI